MKNDLDTGGTRIPSGNSRRAKATRRHWGVYAEWGGGDPPAPRPCLRQILERGDPRSGAAAWIGVTVEIRNQARVPLRYPGSFGIPYPPVTALDDGIGSFPCRSTAVGIRHARAERCPLDTGNLCGQGGALARALAAPHGAALAGAGQGQEFARLNANSRHFLAPSASTT
ncbi:nucleotidyltransferase family protein [Skermanella rosea]|uniref:nucleotidyltransferase family protein n=1 Tax=Skermanella rosea TaxID=1817965 RepID=UPI001931CF9D|nr:nucleotidyltransferase family protein [Skermanella rosea]